MIPEAAVEAYLDRQLNDHRWLKKLGHKALDLALSRLDPAPDLHPALHLHQKVCFLLGVAFPQFAFWVDMGAGKTLTILELLRYWTQAGKMRRSLVFVLSDKAFPTWEKQIRRFEIGLPYVALEDSSEDKWRQLRDFGDGIVLLTYAGATAMCSQRVKKKKGKGHEWKLVDKLVDQLAENVDVIVWDESTRAGHYTSLTHKLCAKLAARISIRYALAGLPFGRDPTLLWGQQKLVDNGETLGPTLGLFRAAFFTEEDSQWSDWAKNYTFDKRKQKRLSKMLQHRSITYAEGECVDLPPCRSMVETVKLPEEASAYYKRIVENIIASKGNLREMENSFIRMRQLSSGFLGFRDDETGEKAEIEFAANPKFDRLMDLLEEVPYNRKAVVAYEFTWSGRKIFEELKKRDLGKVIWLWSGTKNYRKDLDRFENDPDCRVAVINNRIGSYSLDGLQVANYQFIYESPVAVIDRKQLERRIQRQGQLHKVFRYDLVVRGTADAKILAFHKEGADLYKALMKDPELVLGLKKAA